MKYQLDARNLLCPLPVIRTQNKVKELVDGDILEVVCTDPGTLQDIPSWCRINRHELLATRQEAREIILTILVHRNNHICCHPERSEGSPND